MDNQKAEKIVTLIDRLVFELDDDEVTVSDVINRLTYVAWDEETASQLDRTCAKPLILNFI